MSHRVWATMVVVGLTLGFADCGDSLAVPTSPTPPPALVTGPRAAAMVGEPIKGTVYDSALRPLAGATVELLDGPQAGMSTATDAKGGFSLVATVDDQTRVRASKDGHVTATTTIRPSCERCNPRRWAFLYLELLEPPVPIAGDYTLTFVADSACTNLPVELRQRHYEATLVPSDLGWPATPAHSETSFKVTARGSDFPAGLNGFYLNVAGTYINVSLGDHTDPGFTERVAPNTYLAFGGWGVTSAEAPVSTIVASFQGWIDVCVNPDMGSRYDCTPGPAVARTRCESTSHRLILTRH